MIDLKELYLLQASLDEEIAKNHDVTYESTFKKRLLALIVEIGELANETRCFKFWSNKGPSSKEIIMDEFADGIHFFLSLGIPIHASKHKYRILKNNSNLEEQILDVYKASIKLLDNYDLNNYYDAFQKYLNLSASIGMSEEDIINSYKAKLKINHVRQETNY